MTGISFAGKGRGLLSLDGSHAGQHFTFNSLKQSTAAGGNVAHLVGKAELVDTSHGVATTDE